MTAVYVPSSVKRNRRNLWAQVSDRVEIWIEKDALAGVVFDVTNWWQVPLMATRGYPSITFVHSAATEIEASDRPTYIYYFGDYDPSGVDISRDLEAKLRKYSGDAEIHFKRVLVNEDDIVEMGLRTRPTKKSDSRSKNFRGESVELDAVPPNTLRAIVDEHIETHVDEESHLESVI